jgi:nicotinamidase-related amidase
MDVQRSIVERYDQDGVVLRIAQALAAARAAAVPAIFVRVAFRAGHPEISSHNRSFAALRDGGRLLDDESTAIDPRVAPRDDEVVVTKRRVSAFAGSDLDVVLRAGGIERLVLCGIATSGVVLSTVRAAADLDFDLTVLRDGCADGDDDVHDLLMDAVFPRQARVVDVAAWSDELAVS